VALTTEGNEPLEADPLLFRQALSNVVSNALRHTPRGGKVTVSVKRPDPEWVAVEVRDTGSGIDPAHLPKVFDRFYRSDHSRSQFSGGAGLGLPIVKSIMQLHRGEAEIRSEPVKGTTVILKFPFPPPTAT
jgi:signal transduction histidine kinase